MDPSVPFDKKKLVYSLAKLDQLFNGIELHGTGEGVVGKVVG
jgi:hypothetical protein